MPTSWVDNVFLLAKYVGLLLQGYWNTHSSSIEVYFCDPTQIGMNINIILRI